MTLHCPKGAEDISPGQGNASPASVPPPWVIVPNGCPSPVRAKDGQRQHLFCPFRAIVWNHYPTQGGAPRLRRFALPWADILLPLRGGFSFMVQFQRRSLARRVTRTRTMVRPLPLVRQVNEFVCHRGSNLRSCQTSWQGGGRIPRSKMWVKTRGQLRGVFPDTGRGAHATIWLRPKAAPSSSQLSRFAERNQR